MTVRAVLIDLDDTLFDHGYCAREALTGLRSLHACLEGLSLEALEQSHAKILEELHLDVMAGRMDLDAARVERFRRLYLAAGIEADADLAARTAAAYRSGYLTARRPVPGAAEFLAAVGAPGDEVEATPLVQEADPELERLLAEEEEIERRLHEHHETPKFHGDGD